MKLLEKGENVMHVRYEAMLADPLRFSRELETFLPQLAKLDPESSGIGDAWKCEKPLSALLLAPETCMDNPPPTTMRRPCGGRSLLPTAW